MHINKLLLAHALGLALTAAAPQSVKPRIDDTNFNLRPNARIEPGRCE